MKPIGGFFELELGRGNQCWHEGALALNSGRACLNFILRTTRFRKVHLPFYISDTVLPVLKANGVDHVFYPIGETLEPDPPIRLSDGEGLLVVNYFGLRSASSHRLAERFENRVIVDNTQAFFEKRMGPGWAFNSARKFFGVPDGGYLYGAGGNGAVIPENDQVKYEHLVNRILGKQELAFGQFQESENGFDAEIKKMSPLAERILANIDYEWVKRARIANFARMHAQLKEHNTLQFELGDQTPCWYPFLPERALDRSRLYRQSIFSPTLWEDVIRRPDRGFGWERTLSEKLQALPIDQRYGAGDIDWVCGKVLEALK